MFALGPDTEGSTSKDQATNNMEDNSDEEDGAAPMTEPEQAKGLKDSIPKGMRWDPWLEHYLLIF